MTYRTKITTSDDSAAVVLPQELLDALGIQVGDEIDVSQDGNTLILRSIDEAERARKFEQVREDVFERRAGAYQKLAEGVK